MARPERETNATPGAYSFVRFQNYVSDYGSCIIVPQRSLIPFLADMYRALFRFGVFNAVQSSCFDMVRENEHLRGQMTSMAIIDHEVR